MMFRRLSAKRRRELSACTPPAIAVITMLGLYSISSTVAILNPNALAGAVLVQSAVAGGALVGAMTGWLVSHRRSVERSDVEDIRWAEQKALLEGIHAQATKAAFLLERKGQSARS